MRLEEELCMKFPAVLRNKLLDDEIELPDTTMVEYEKILVYMEVPIFFLCKDERQYYVTLCTDMDELNYVVTEASMADVYRLLHGEVPMRDAILNQERYWEVVSGEEICMDKVVRHFMDEMNGSLLPQEDAYFEILTEDMEEFVRKFDMEYCRGQKESSRDKIPYIDLSGLNFDIERCFDLGVCLLSQPVISSLI